MRLALEPLSSLQADTPVDYALIGRDGRLTRDGRAPLRQLGALARTWPAYAILHESDAIVTRVTVPPVPVKRLRPAVLATIEPMALSDIEELAVGHGPQAVDGGVTVAWASRGALRRAWATMAAAGLTVAGFVPRQLLRPQAGSGTGAGGTGGTSDTGSTSSIGNTGDTIDTGDKHDAGSAMAWLAPLPDWSLHDAIPRPTAGLGRWRRALAWTGAAAALWIVGLNIYALQRGSQLKALRQAMTDAVAQAFPKIPVIIDPLRQAQQQRDALSRAQGWAATDDFMPLALATARVLGFAQSHVRALRYDKGVLTLTLADGFVPPANEAALAQTAAVQRVLLEKDAAQPQVWHVRRPGTSGAQNAHGAAAHGRAPARDGRTRLNTQASLP
ncbi:GspL/Epsl periplasmic domain-containing protein [Candidimonas nitroreducens]|nr:GspL/Epsl periplasmic domain-containing protein [Candidimonas nitroreducens]